MWNKKQFLSVLIAIEKIKLCNFVEENKQVKKEFKNF